MPAPRLLIVKLSSLGDIVHAVPAADAIRRHLGAETMDWVTQPEYVDFVKCIEGVGRVIPFPRRNFLAGLPAFRAELNRQTYDLAVDLQGLMKSAVAARLSRAPDRLAPSFARELSGLLHTRAARPSGRSHAVWRCLDSARALGAPADDARFPFRFPHPPAGTLPEDGRPRVALAPCSRWPAKNWPLDRFAALARHLVDHRGAHVSVIGGAADRPAAEELQRQAGVPLDLRCGGLDLPHLGGYLRALDLLVTNDSGPMHIAAALGTRVLALFGPTDPARTGPWGARCTVLRPEGIDPAAIPASAYKCADLSYMQAISLERVITELAKV